MTDQSGEEDYETGFLTATLKIRPTDQEELVERLPEDWLESDGETQRVRRARRQRLPRPVHINPLAQESDDGELFHFVTAPFRFCLNCRVSYSGRQRSDYGKLALLSSEGRSTATSVLSLDTLRALRNDDTLEPKARKLQALRTIDKTPATSRAFQ